jgi:hypothetical protein
MSPTSLTNPKDQFCSLFSRYSVNPSIQEHHALGFMHIDTICYEFLSRSGDFKNHTRIAHCWVLTGTEKKFNHQKDFYMNIIFNGLDRSFKFWYIRYKREIRNILCFIKHISPPIYLYYYIKQLKIEGFIFCHGIFLLYPFYPSIRWIIYIFGWSNVCNCIHWSPLSLHFFLIHTIIFIYAHDL